MDEKEAEQIVEKVKRKRPKQSELMKPQTDPGDNTKYLLVSMELAKLPKVDLKNPEEVDERINRFFQIQADNDLKPTVAGLGLALGVDRRRLWEIRSGAAMGGHTAYDLPRAVVDAIKKAYEIMENLWENYMQNGKINPVSGIFLGKNNFGYQDKTEYVVTPNVQNDSDYDAEDIRKRYLTENSEATTIESNTDGDC